MRVIRNRLNKLPTHSLEGARRVLVQALESEKSTEDEAVLHYTIDLLESELLDRGIIPETNPTTSD